MKGYLKIKTMKTEPGNYGRHFVISKIGFYNENGKWIKWVKLNDLTTSLLLGAKIPIQLDGDTAKIREEFDYFEK